MLQNMSLSRGSRVAVLVAWLATLGSLGAYFDAMAERTRHDGPIPHVSDNQLLPPVPVLRVMGLGQDTLMATVLWIKALAYFGEHFSRDRRYKWLETYIDTIAELDPKFKKLFEWAGVVVMYGGQIDNTSVRASNRILEKGLELFPDDWQIAFMLGCNYAFELKTSDPEQKKRNIETAITYLRRASYAPGAPSHIILFVSSLYKRVGWMEAAAAYLEEAYLHANDPKLKEKLARHLMLYRQKTQVERLEEAREQMEREWKESFPYMPEGLFRIVGRRIDGRVPDWHAFLGSEGASEQDLSERVLQGSFIDEGLGRELDQRGGGK